jgi:RND family efflux transporter MFP subunit
MTMVRTGLAALLLGAGFLAACDQDTPEPEAAPIPVRVETVVEHGPDDDLALTYTASLEAITQLSLSFQTDGNVISLLQVEDADGSMRKVEPGDPVAEGTVLASLDPRQLQDQLIQAQAQLAAAQATLATAQENWKRIQTLYEEQSATATEYDDARQQFQSAQANVTAASAQVDQANDVLGDTDLASPLTGVVVQRYIEVGSVVSPATTAFELADPSQIKAVFGLPDNQLDAIKLGDRLSITTQSLPDQAFAGTVRSISPAADSATRLYSVELGLNNSDNALKIGMVASLVLQIGEEAAQASTIPIDALVREDGKAGSYAVFVVETTDGASVARERSVTIGEVHGNRIAVLSGLEAGDAVVVVGTNTVRDGQPVQVVR